MTSCIALVVAAGRGTRLRGPLPKQYLPLAGKPLLRYSLDALVSHPGIAVVRVVRNPDDAALYDAAVAHAPVFTVTGAVGEGAQQEALEVLRRRWQLRSNSSGADGVSPVVGGEAWCWGSPTTRRWSCSHPHEVSTGAMRS